MSFDLYVWHEDAPITADAARTKLERWDAGEAGVFAPHPAVAAVHDALLLRFPALESLAEDDEDDLGVWSMTPEPSDSLLVLSCVWSHADDVATAVSDLAAEHGVVCYEPGHHIVDPNAPGYVARFTLTSAALPDVPDPDADRIDRVVGKLNDDNHFTVLERADGWYAQIGYGVIVDAAPGTYVLEYREGTADRHFATSTTDIAEARRFLREFLAGDETWKKRHAWRALTLD